MVLKKRRFWISENVFFEFVESKNYSGDFRLYLRLTTPGGEKSFWNKVQKEEEKRFQTMERIETLSLNLRWDVKSGPDWFAFLVGCFLYSRWGRTEVHLWRIWCKVWQRSCPLRHIEVCAFGDEGWLFGGVTWCPRSPKVCFSRPSLCIEVV